MANKQQTMTPELMTSPTLNELIEPSTLSAEIYIGEQTLAQWRYLGKGPAYIKVGKHVRYRRSDVEAWLDAQTRGGTDDAA